MISVLGWEWEYIDEYMTVPRLEALHKYWKQAPPLAEAFAAFVGIESTPEGTPEDLMRELGMIEGMRIEQRWPTSKDA